MASKLIGTTTIQVEGDASGLVSSIEKALGDIDLSSLAPKAALAGGIALIGQQFVSGAQDAIKFQNRIDNVMSVLPNITGKALREMQLQVLDLSNTFGFAATDIADGMTELLGRGVDLEDTGIFSEQAAKLARATGSSYSTAIEGLTNATRTYGEENLSAQQAASALFATFRTGGAPLDQIVTKMYDVLPVASGLGVSFEEVASLLSSLTSRGQTAAIASTQLRTALTEMSRDGTRASKTFMEMTGMTFPQFIQKGGSVQQAMELMAKATGHSDKALQQLVDSHYTTAAILNLTGDATEDVNDKFLQVANGTESFNKAFENMDNTFGARVQKLQNSAKNARMELIAAFKPIAGEVFDQIANLIDEWTPRVTEFARNLQASFESNGDVFSEFGEHVMTVVRIVQTVFEALKPTIQVFFAFLFVGFETVRTAIGPFLGAFEQAAKVVEMLKYPLAGLAAAIGTYIVTWNLYTLALTTNAGAKGIVGNAAKALGGKLKALWAVMKANPVIAVASVLVGLATAFVMAWRNSETFRKIVINTFKGIQIGAGEAVAAVLVVLKQFIQGATLVARGAVKLWSKMPTLLGGGVASKVDDAVDEIFQGMDRIIGKARELAHSTDWLNGLEDFGAKAKDATKDADGLNKSISDLAGAKIKLPKMPELNDPNLFAPDDKDAKKKAESLRKALMSSLTKVGKALSKWGKNAGKQTVDSLKNNFESALQAMRDAVDAAQAAGNKAVEKALKDQAARLKASQKQLLALAKQRDKVFDKLKTAKDELKAIKDEAKGFRDSIYDTIVGMGSVAEASKGIGVTFRGIRNNLRDAIRTSTAFNTALNELRKMNLDEDLLRQLAEAGPEAALGQARAIVRSGQRGVNELNALQDDLRDIAKKSSKDMYNEFYASGVSIAEGIVKGLDSQHAKLVKQMDKLADAMVSSIKKKLKIKSPSGIFADEVGEPVSAGIARGVTRNGTDVARALREVVNTQNVDIGGITVTGVSDPAAARRAGILAGEGVRSVLERRNTAAVLNGVG